MKKILIISICIFITLLAFTGCNSNNSSLPKGRASSIYIIDNDRRDMGSGEFEYLNETTIKFISDEDKRTYYFSTSNLYYIEEEKK